MVDISVSSLGSDVINIFVGPWESTVGNISVILLGGNVRNIIF